MAWSAVAHGGLSRSGRAGVLAAAVVAGAALATGGAAGAAGAAGTGRSSAAHPAVATGWGRAEKVPGLAALNRHGNAQVSSVSCARAGNCGAGGYYNGVFAKYYGRLVHGQGFVVSERNGRWGKAEEVPGLAALNKGGNAQVVSVSCPAAGNCVAVGSYTDRSGHAQGFVVRERTGRWGKAAEVPGLAALNKGGHAQVSQVSCARVGDCGAGGSYLDGSGSTQGFVVSQRNGRWRDAQEVPGLAALNVGGDAVVNSVSCGAAGDCGAGGTYEISVGVDGGPTPFQGFVVSERNGRWHAAQEVPGLAALNTIDAAQVSVVSCPSAGNCSAGGYYTPGDPGSGPWYPEMFVVSERNGRWGTAQLPPLANALENGWDEPIVAISCASAGNCSAGGYFYDGAGHWVAFVVSQQRGRWAEARPVPGTANDDVTGVQSTVDAVSCPSAGNCGAGGFIASKAFVVNERNGRLGRAQRMPGLARLGGGAAVISVSCPRPGNCIAGGYYTDRSKPRQGWISG